MGKEFIFLLNFSSEICLLAIGEVCVCEFGI